MGRQTNLLKRQLDQASKKQTFQTIDLEEPTHKRFKCDSINYLQYQMPSFNLTNFSQLSQEQSIGNNLGSRHDFSSVNFESLAHSTIDDESTSDNSNTRSHISSQLNNSSAFYDFSACLNFNFNINLFQSFID